MVKSFCSRMMRPVHWKKREKEAIGCLPLVFSFYLGPTSGLFPQTGAIANAKSKDAARTSRVLVRAAPLSNRESLLIFNPRPVLPIFRTEKQTASSLSKGGKTKQKLAEGKIMTARKGLRFARILLLDPTPANKGSLGTAARYTD